MNKLILCLIIITVVGCTSLSGIPATNEIIKFNYNDAISFQFNIPANSIDTNPNRIQSHSSFYDNDLNNNTQKVLWLLNRTYEQISLVTYSGKYSVGLAAFGVDTNKIQLNSVTDLEILEKQYYKEEFYIEVDFERKKIAGHNWLLKKHKNGSQNTVNAYLIISKSTYLVFTFEYLGEDQDELQAMRHLAEDTLNSFSMLKKQNHKNKY